MTEPQRYPTRDELDYERRKAAGFPGLGVPLAESKGQVSSLQTLFATEENETTAYIGVTQDRMTYSNDTEKPYAAETGTELDREERLVGQTPLVAPSAAPPEPNQTEGGGSSVETVYTATSGERWSSEIANPPTTEKVPAEEAPAGVAPDAEGQVEQGVGGGSSGQTVSEAVEGEQNVAAAASPAPDQLSEAEGEPTAPVDEPSTEQGEPATSTAETPSTGVPTPTSRTKKATDAKSNATDA